MLQRKATFSNVSEILEGIHQAKCAGEKKYKIPGTDFSVKTKSQRYELFHKETTCVVCGLKGTIFALESDMVNKSDNYPWHLNLYGILEDGTEVLMTKDHIVPKSKGGKDWIGNYQTMCHPCNREKGCTI